METWKESWSPASTAFDSGGQGVVTKVIHQASGTAGALKQLHPEHLGNTERRFRMQQEVNALLALDGHGVPKVLETNVSQWRDKDKSLYIVMDWVDGPTLSQFVGGNALPLERALVITRSLLDTLGRCHALDVYHRDLKPDNIIVKGGMLESIVLVDFGMSWTKRDDAASDFRTHLGQEIGNRFLRLPEHVPGRHIHDPRSDLTMAVGLLFYMLIGQAPRALRDVNGAMPHELMADRFPDSTTQDPRWPRLRRVFNVGFQENIDRRFPTCRDLVERLDSLTPPAGLNPDTELREELGRLNDLLSSERARELTALKEILSEASSKYLASHQRRLQGTGFVSGGSGPNIVEGGRSSLINFFIVQQGTSEPQARFSHRIAVLEDEIVATVTIENDTAETYYRGPVSDKDGLLEAVELRVPVVLTALFRVMRNKLQSIY